MNQITKNKANSLNQLILNDPLIQEFKKYEKTLREHPELLSLEDEIKQESQIILKKKALGELTDEELKAYQDKKEYFENHPLIVNYLNLKSEVNDYLIQVETIINEELFTNVGCPSIKKESFLNSFKSTYYPLFCA